MSRLNDGMFSSNTDMWATPQAFFDELDQEFHFTLDPCATPENAKCKMFYTIDNDGLTQNWGGQIMFCNPPYGRAIGAWVKKCYEESLKPNTKKAYADCCTAGILPFFPCRR